MKIIIKSHAKINFGLNIIRKREDGFHDINTIFYPIELHDVLTFEKAAYTELTTNSVQLASEISSNLILRSISLLESYTKKELPCKIHLDKKIPMGAGLGGGSSNAACTLLSVNDLYQLRLTQEELLKIASQIGSDVACFLRPNPTYGESRGEVLTDIEFEINKPFVLLNPGIHIATLWAYQQIKPKSPDYNLLETIKEMHENFSAFQGKVINDFEEPVFQKYPMMKTLKDEFYNSGAEFALMSGSGSTLFGIFSNAEDALTFSKKFQDKYFIYIQLPENYEH